MTRWLCGIVFWSGIACAASPTGIWLPTVDHPASSGGTGLFSGTADRMTCLNVVTHQGVANATKIAIGANVGGQCGVAIYSANGSSALMRTSFVCNTGTVATKTGLSAFTLSDGTEYRYCWCKSTTGGGYAAIRPHSEPAASSSFGFLTIVNAFAPNFGIAANSCAGGLPPTTTGSITAATGSDVTLPLNLWVSSE